MLGHCPQELGCSSKKGCHGAKRCLEHPNVAPQQDSPGGKRGTPWQHEAALARTGVGLTTAARTDHNTLRRHRHTTR